MHAGQLHIDAVVVERLLRVQFPQWKDLPVEEVRATGTVNALFRIGKGLVARFPLVGQDPDDARAWCTWSQSRRTRPTSAGGNCVTSWGPRARAVSI